jgi:hypothetical protein
MDLFKITDEMIDAAEQELLNIPGDEITDESLARSNVFKIIEAAFSASNISMVDCRTTPDE